MPTGLERFSLETELRREVSGALYRAHDRETGLPVLVRLAPSAGERDIGRLLEEAAILADLTGAAVEQVVQIEGRILALTDSGDCFLSNLSRHGGLPIDEFLTIACALAAAIDTVHQRGILHRDLHPGQVRLRRADGQVRLIGFGRASRQPRETAASRAPALIDGDLRYIAPEQTGRMNRPVDHRSDLYTIGVILYELLTGRLPLEASDPMGWIHAHIARSPVPAAGLRPEVPGPLSAVIDRLLAKSADQRYQSAASLHQDLKDAAAEWQASGRIDRLVVGLHDRLTGLTLPDRLFGRDLERASLLAAFDRAAVGRAELVLVAGHSGIGKTALIHELEPAVARDRGYFAWGKHDQLHRGRPYLALRQALGVLLRQILTEDEAALSRWRDRLTRALDHNAGLVVDVLPELAMVVGARTAPPDLPPAEAQNRFHSAIGSLIRCFATGEQPLVLVLDDLQWADTASLALLVGLLADPDCRNLLVIGAYRSNEVTPEHPLMRTIERLGSSVQITRLMLAPLSAAEVKAWLSVALNSAPAAMTPLAMLLTRKSGGNPFALGQLVTRLATDGLILPGTEGGSWTVDVAAVLDADLPDEVADLLADRLARLPDATVALVTLAACLGDRCPAGTLAIAAAASRPSLAERLVPAVEDGLLIPYTDGTEVGWRFAHDRVRRTAYDLIAAEDRPAQHLMIGRRLRDATPPAASFEVATHLNLGRSLITDPAERASLCRLNHAAASGARASAAFETLYGLLQVAIDLLPTTAEDAPFCLRVLLDAAEAAYLNKDFAGFDALLARARPLAADPDIQVEVTRTAVQGQIARNDYRAALDQALEGLRALGITFSEAAGKRDTFLMLARLRLKMLTKPVERLGDLPIATDPWAIRAMIMLATAYSAAHLRTSATFAPITLLGTLLTYRYGLTPQSPLLVNGTGLVLITALDDVGNGYRFGQAAMQIGARLNIHHQSSNFYYLVKHWRDPVRDSAAPVLAAHETLDALGNFESASHSISAYVATLYFCLDDLRLVQKEIDRALAYGRRRGLSFSIDAGNAIRVAVSLLTGESTEDVATQRIQEGVLGSTRQTTAFRTSGLARAMHVSLIFGRLDHARRLAAEIRPGLPVVAGMIGAGVFVFHEALAFVDLWHTPDRTQRRAARARVLANLRQLRHWARYAPVNQRHRVRLIEGELALRRGQMARAERLIEAAIDDALAGSFIGDAALAAESLARLHETRGHAREAGRAYAEAYDYYRRWGAEAKLRLMEQSHPELRQRRPAVVEAPPEPRAGASVDIEAVTRAAQAITGELVLSRLIERLLDTMMQNAGARYAALIMIRDGAQWLVAERGVTSPASGEPSEPRPVAATDLPQPLLNYVQRSLDGIVLEDAAQANRFGHSARWHRSRACSVLAVPIVRQGSCTGLLYLENDLAAGVFTPERTELLQVLAAHAANALANAQLFEQLEQARRALEGYSQGLEQKVAERTQELQRRSEDLAQSLEKLKAAQAQMVVQEKMASLGQMTAGIAHEIKNPLNFINNFAMLSAELIDELKEAIADEDEEGVATVLAQLAENLRKIQDHGNRADRIVRAMVQHARPGSTERETVDLNRLVAEAAELARHSRADREGAPTNGATDPRYLDRHQPTGQVIELTLWPTPLRASVLPQDVSRAVINLLGNAIDATTARERAEKRAGRESAYRPRISVTTQAVAGDKAVIRVRDNGTGMTAAVKAKLFTPFFTTKPTGEGTGLGLSLSYDVIVGQHGGAISVESEPNSHAEFTITLPCLAGGSEPADQRVEG